VTRNEKSTRAYVLSLVAGLLITGNTGLLGAAATRFPKIIPTIPGSSIDTAGLYRLTAIGLILGVLVILGAVMLRIRPANKMVWGIMIIVFSIPSVVTGGGFIIGFILGIIGGASALSRKPRTPS
jgi:hypothetical protein